MFGNKKFYADMEKYHIEIDESVFLTPSEHKKLAKKMIKEAKKHEKEESRKKKGECKIKCVS